MKDKYDIVFEEKIRSTKYLIQTFFKSGDDISISLIQRKCSSGYIIAATVLKELIKSGIVEPLQKNSEITKIK